jgi:predicted CXXCH cytochrome family protein
MTKGVSVHSQGELSCAICHSARPEGDKVEMELTVPEAQLCFACHERAAMQQHVAPTAKKGCLDCHDAHRSDRAMLLRRDVNTDYGQSSATSFETKHANSGHPGEKPHAVRKRGNGPHAQSGVSRL